MVASWKSQPHEPSGKRKDTIGWSSLVLAPSSQNTTRLIQFRKRLLTNAILS